MSNKISLTIIIPTYNSAEYLKKTLDFLTNQTCQNFKIIMVDDNSTDTTMAIAESFKIEIIIKPKKITKGAAASLNYVLPMIKTPYTALIDSDAYLADNWVETMLELLPQHKIIGAPILADNHNGLIAKLVGLDIESRYHAMPEILSHLSTCNLAFRSEILKDFHFDENLMYAYDHQLSFWLGRENIKFFLTRKTFCHHGNKNSFKNYLLQQYQIGVNHTVLSMNMPKEASRGSEISPVSLILQLPLTTLIIALLFINYFWALGFIILFLISNSRYLIYLNHQKPFGLIFLAILLIFSRNIVWIFAFIMGIIKHFKTKLIRN